jgi:hypothetical protein
MPTASPKPVRSQAALQCADPELNVLSGHALAQPFPLTARLGDQAARAPGQSIRSVMHSWLWPPRAYLPFCAFEISLIQVIYAPNGSF